MYFKAMLSRLEKTSVYLSTRIYELSKRAFLESKQDEERWHDLLYLLVSTGAVIGQFRGPYISCTAR